jgi:hypothetical protein
MDGILHAFSIVLQHLQSYATLIIITYILPTYYLPIYHYLHPMYMLPTYYCNLYLHITYLPTYLGTYALLTYIT